MSELQYRFAEFQLDCASFELRRHGRAQKSDRISLERIPMELLILLLERQGNVVTRQEIIDRLWGKDVFVDTEHGINTAIRKIRQALRDDPERPRFVQTVTGKGYRFIAERSPTDGRSAIAAPATEAVVPPQPPALSAGELAPAPRPRFRLAAVTRKLVALTILVLLTMSILGFALYGRLARKRAMVTRVRSIAVLPLGNLSRDPEQEYFADGMTEALINDLCKIGSLRVISRTSVMQYKGTRKPLPEIARALRVDAVVEGSVQRVGDRVRISAELIDAASDAHLWGRSFDRDLNDVLLLESDVAQAIAGEILVKVTPSDTARIPLTHVVNSKAHDAYLRGRYLWSSKSKPGVEQSITFYQQAIEEDPQYALAYAAMADSYIILENDGHMSASEANPQIRMAAMKAVAADPNLAEAHIMMADVKEMEWDWAGAEQEYKRATELNPGLARAHHWYAILLSALQRHDEAIAEIERAIDLEPLTPSLYRVQSDTYYLAGRNDLALRALARPPVLQENDAVARYSSARIYLRKGEGAEAISRVRAVVDSQPGDAKALALLGYAYALTGKKKEALAALDKLRDLSKVEYIEPGWMAMIWVGLGDNDKALTLLDQDYRRHSSFLMSIGSDPAFEPLHADGRFQDLLHRVGLVPK